MLVRLASSTTSPTHLSRGLLCSYRRRHSNAVTTLPISMCFVILSLSTVFDADDMQTSHENTMTFLPRAVDNTLLKRRPACARLRAEIFQKFQMGFNADLIVHLNGTSNFRRPYRLSAVTADSLPLWILNVHRRYQKS